MPAFRRIPSASDCAPVKGRLLHIPTPPGSPNNDRGRYLLEGSGIVNPYQWPLPAISLIYSSAASAPVSTASAASSTVIQSGVPPTAANLSHRQRRPQQYSV